jgi:hypothetical protein
VVKRLATITSMDGERRNKMTDILIDLTTKKRYKVKRCHYCNHDKYPEGKIIDPSDKYARHTDKGDWKCGYCVGEDTKKILNMMNRQKGILI